MARTQLPSLRQVQTTADGKQSPVLPYYLLAKDAAEGSTLSVGSLGGFVERSVGGQAAPMWMLDMAGQVENLNISVLPVGWTGDWHESPHPQWVVPLSGRWFIEAQDGTRVEMGPGDIHWGQDIGTRGNNDRRGHRSGQLGPDPCVIMMVQFSVTTTLPQAREEESEKT